MALGARPESAHEQKHAIARWAASVIVPGDNILLDAGSTVDALAHELRGFEKLSVTTPGINTLQELADSEGIEVDCLGGRQRSLSQSFVGPLAEAALERMSFDRVFLRADSDLVSFVQGHLSPSYRRSFSGTDRTWCPSW